MAGFSKVKRKVTKLFEDGRSEVVLEDNEPYEVGYQKFYCNEDMFYFSNELFNEISSTLTEGIYNLEVDTLDAYLNSNIKYHIKLRRSAFAVEENLGILSRNKPYCLDEDF